MQQGPGSCFAVHYMCKPVQGRALVTCCKITGIGLINETLQLSPLRLTHRVLHLRLYKYPVTSAIPVVRFLSVLPVI